MSAPALPDFERTIRLGQDGEEDEVAFTEIVGYVRVVTLDDARGFSRSRSQRSSSLSDRPKKQ